MSPAESSREENVYMAMLVEQAERMVEFAKVAKTVDGEELTVEEWNLRSVVYKNAIGACRSSWRIISSIEQKEESRGNDDRVSMIKEYRGKIEGVVSKICVWILGLLDSHLIPSSTAVETKFFYLKIKGDYHRYLAEFKTGAEWEEAAESTLLAYESAKDIVLANLAPTHPIRVGLVVGLNYSVACNEFSNSPDRPCNLAKQGTAFSQPKGFNLSSGEFPALGSDKNPELNVQGHSSQGHPASSGAAAAPRERLGMSSTEDGGSMEACTERGTVNTWKGDSPPYQGGPPASTEKWPRDPQQAQPYPNMAMLHHPFHPWHAATPPIRTPPEGDWYGGGVPGPPASTEKWPWDPQQAQPYPNMAMLHHPFHPWHAATPPMRTPPEGDWYGGGVPVGPYGPTGLPGTYQSQKFHPGSSNYHVRPGMAAGSGVHNRYQSQKFHPGSSNYHVRPGVHGSDPEVAKEHESPIGYSTHQGPYKVLLKQHDGRLDKNAEEKRGHSVATSVRGVDRRIGENNWGTDASNDEPMDFSKPAIGEDDTSSQPTGVHGRFSSVSIVGNEPDKTGLANTDSSLKIPETDAIPADHSQQLPDAKKCAHLIDKIEGLNTKARASEVGFASKDEKTKRFKIVNSQQPAPISLPQVISDDLTAGKVDGSQINKSNGQLGSSSGNMGVAVETKNDESKHNNEHGKTQALWRQRGSGKPSHISHGGALLSPEQSKTNQMTIDPHQPSKLDITSSKRQTQNSENRSHIPAPMAQAAGDSFIKDHGASEKVRKPTQKVQRGGGHNHTPTVKDMPSGVADKTEIKTLAFESIESGGKSISRSEGQGSGERMVSQWQPKSQAYPAHNLQGNRGNDKVMGSQRNAAQVGRASGKDFPSQGLESIPQRADWDSNVLVQQPNHFETQKPSVTEIGTPHFQEIRKERSGQEHPSATSTAFHAPANADGSLQL